MGQYLILIKGSKIAEQELNASKELQLQMNYFNDQLESAKVKVMAKGLYPTSEATRIRYIDGAKEIVKGPFFPESEQVEGFFILSLAGDEEAMEWFMKVPDPIGHNQGLVELRKIR